MFSLAESISTSRLSSNLRLLLFRSCGSCDALVKHVCEAAAFRFGRFWDFVEDAQSSETEAGSLRPTLQ